MTDTPEAPTNDAGLIATVQPSSVLAAPCRVIHRDGENHRDRGGKMSLARGPALEREHSQGRQRAALLHRLACAGRNDVDRIAWPDRRGKAFRRIERNREGDCPLQHGRPDVRRGYGLPRRDIVKHYVTDQLFRCFGQAKQSRRPALVHDVQLGWADWRECLEVADGHHYGDAGKW